MNSNEIAESTDKTKILHVAIKSNYGLMVTTPLYSTYIQKRQDNNQGGQA